MVWNIGKVSWVGPCFVMLCVNTDLADLSRLGDVNASHVSATCSFLWLHIDLTDSGCAAVTGTSRVLLPFGYDAANSQQCTTMQHNKARYTAWPWRSDTLQGGDRLFQISGTLLSQLGCFAQASWPSSSHDQLSRPFEAGSTPRQNHDFPILW